MIFDNDHCRIGSLEMHQLAINTSHVDHCRIGSLETMTPMTEETVKDHCRIGSLENAMRTQFVEKI